jgi:hypothetical protein
VIKLHDVGEGKRELGADFSIVLNTASGQLAIASNQSNQQPITIQQDLTGTNNQPPLSGGSGFTFIEMLGPRRELRAG